ncbi:hypothetical protein ACFVAV_30185 [Nocardia sp. NPDC057663]|uniref:hypothetical protein n=1 Tax=Nocardia sp. NPDC057663 TaxID=3346201 RepID=UPI00366CCA5C
MNELDSAADRFAVGDLAGEDLPMVAAEALARGHDTPALVELACLHRTDTRDAPALFRAALAELGLVADTEATWSAREVDVRLRRVKKDAAGLLAGEGVYVEQVSRIASELYHLAVTPEAGSADLATDFDGFYWGLEDNYWDPDVLRDSIHEGCRTLLAGPPWIQSKDVPVAPPPPTPPKDVPVALPPPTPSRWWQKLFRSST